MVKINDKFETVFGLKRDKRLYCRDLLYLVIYYKKILIYSISLSLIIGILIIVFSQKNYKSAGIYAIEKQSFLSDPDMLGKWDYYELLTDSFYNDLLNSNISIRDKDSLKLKEYIADITGIAIRDESDRKFISEPHQDMIESLKKSCLIFIDEKFGTLRIEVSLPDSKISATLVRIIAVNISNIIIESRIRKKLSHYNSIYSLYLIDDSIHSQSLKALNESIDKINGIYSHIEKLKIDTLIVSEKIARENVNNSWIQTKLSKNNYLSPERLLYEISPPTINLKPSSPKKKIIMINSILLGIWGGITYIFLGKKGKLYLTSKSI